MIRINLFRGKDVRRKRAPSASPGGGGGNTIAAVFFLVILVELGGLYYWYMQVADASQQVATGQQALNKQRDDLKAQIAKKEEYKKLEADMKKKRAIFEVLEHGKVGPLHSLLFFSYALRRVHLDSMNQDEYEALGELWRIDKRSGSGAGRTDSGLPGRADPTDAWNPESVWLTEIKESNGAMTISGQAMSHRDVMVFLDRLKSSIYFEGVDLVNQRVNTKSPLKLDFVEFKLKCELNYDPRQYPAL